MDSAQELRDANEAAAVEANDRAWVELGKIALRRSAAAGVMETAAAWVRKALKAEGKVTACI